MLYFVMLDLKRRIVTGILGDISRLTYFLSNEVAAGNKVISVVPALLS